MCLFHFADITEAVSPALRSVSHPLENFSGSTGFHTAKILQNVFTSTHIPRIVITVYEIIYFL